MPKAPKNKTKERRGGKPSDLAASCQIALHQYIVVQDPVSRAACLSCRTQSGRLSRSVSSYRGVGKWAPPKTCFRQGRFCAAVRYRWLRNNGRDPTPPRPPCVRHRVMGDRHPTTPRLPPPQQGYGSPALVRANTRTPTPPREGQWIVIPACSSLKVPETGGIADLVCLPRRPAFPFAT